MAHPLISLSLLVACYSCGCQNKDSASKPTALPDGSKQTDHNRTAYLLLSKQLTDPWNADKESATTSSDTVQAIANTHRTISELDNLTIDDADLQAVRASHKSAAQDGINSLLKFEKLPRPSNSAELSMTGFLCGLGGRYDLYAGITVDDKVKRDAIISELRNMNNVHSRLCIAKLLLRRPAEKYAGSDKLTGLTVDIDESFIKDQRTWVKLTNDTGRDLSNAMVTVVLTGKSGETKENLHFVADWKCNQSIHAAYLKGVQIQDMQFISQCVEKIQSVRVSVHSDAGILQGCIYQYTDQQKKQDVEREFESIRPLIATWTRGGALGDGKVLIMHNKSSYIMPSVTIETPAGSYSFSNLAPGKSFEVGKLQVSRNLRVGEVVTISIAGYELFKVTI